MGSKEYLDTYQYEAGYDYVMLVVLITPFKNFSATAASNGSLIEWKIALFQKKIFGQINVRLAGGDWKIGMILVTKWFKNWSFQKMSKTTKMPLNWYSSMKKNLERFG